MFSLSNILSTSEAFIWMILHDQKSQRYSRLTLSVGDSINTCALGNTQATQQIPSLGSRGGPTDDDQDGPVARRRYPRRTARNTPTDIRMSPVNLAKVMARIGAPSR